MLKPLACEGRREVKNTFAYTQKLTSYHRLSCVFGDIIKAKERERDREKEFHMYENYSHEKETCADVLCMMLESFVSIIIFHTSLDHVELVFDRL